MVTATSTLPERGRTARWPKMRPRFIVEVRCDAAHVMEALRAAAADADRRVKTSLDAQLGVLTVPEAERAFWSTQLGITVEGARIESDGTHRPTRVLGIFSPHPEIWTAYVLIIGTLVAAGVFGVMIAIVQLALGHSPSALLATLIAALAGGLIYTTTLVGQGLAADEMYRLRSYLDDCLSRAEERARSEPATAFESAQL